MGRMVDAIKDAAALMGLAAEAFRRSSESGRAAAAEEDLAAEAYGHAAAGEYRRFASGQAEASRVLAQKAGELAAESDLDAGMLGEPATRWAPAAAQWGTARRKWDGDGGVLETERARMLERSRQEGTRSAEEAERLAEAEWLALETARDAERLARQSAADAARAQSDPGAQDADAAWRAAMAAAHRAEPNAEGR